MTPSKCHLHLGISAFTHRKPDIPSNPSHSSALLYHRTSRGGVQFLFDEPETRTQFKHMSESRGKAGTHEKEVPQAGPGGPILLEHKCQLKRGHQGDIIHNALQPLASLVVLQVDVEDAATQAAGLAR